jgi:hypothetical protein
MTKPIIIDNLIKNLKVVIKESKIIRLKKDSEKYSLVLDKLKNQNIKIYESKDSCLIVSDDIKIDRSFIL